MQIIVSIFLHMAQFNFMLHNAGTDEDLLLYVCCEFWGAPTDSSTTYSSIYSVDNCLSFHSHVFLWCLS